MAVKGVSNVRTPWVYPLNVVAPLNATKSTVPSSLINEEEVWAVKQVAAVHPEKNPLSSASLLTTPLISCTLLCKFKGNSKLPA